MNAPWIWKTAVLLVAAWIFILWAMRSARRGNR